MERTLKKVVRRAAPAPRTAPPPQVAADVMNTKCARLEVSLSLGNALTRFATHCMQALPVVDEDGYLVGVFSVEDALRLCVPEHLLWVDELPGTGDLESFTEMLGEEARRPLADVMLVGGSHVTVRESTPLMQVARLMAKHSAPQVMVVERRELRGVVTAPGLLNRLRERQAGRRKS